MNHDFTRSEAKLNLSKTIAKMLALRSAIGADTPAGHRISNIDEIRQNLARSTNMVQQQHLDASLSRQLRDLEQVRRGHE